MTIEGIYMEYPHCKAVFSREFCKSRQKRPKLAVSGELRGLHVNFLFPSPEKAHPCVEPRHLMYYA